MIPRQEVLEARRRGEVVTLEERDLLVLGALADAVRKEEIGDDVKIHTQGAPDGLELVRGKGLELLRALALARIRGPRAARIGVDWSECGLELAQVALGFGASELVGPIQNKRGLPIADGAARKVKGEGMVAEKTLKKKELAALVARCRRRAVFEEEGA